MKTYQQGDLIIKEVNEDDLPKLKSKGDNIVAEGELTGHRHVINGNCQVMVAERPDIFKDVVWLKVSSPCTITHEEHKPIKLAPAWYEVRRVQEYDYFQKMTSRVRD